MFFARLTSYGLPISHSFQSAGPACPFGKGDSCMNQVSGVPSVRSGVKVQSCDYLLHDYVTI